MSAFVKHDEKKLPLGLLPPAALQSVAAVLAHGRDKYAAWNWVKCPDRSRYYDAAQRHLLAWQRGEPVDPESNLPHLAHALCNLMFLHEMERLGLGNDGRPTDRYLRDMAMASDLEG